MTKTPWDIVGIVVLVGLLIVVFGGAAVAMAVQNNPDANDVVGATLEKLVPLVLTVAGYIAGRKVSS